jgi:DNA mismatch endonuclease (patch repair protein)
MKARRILPKILQKTDPLRSRIMRAVQSKDTAPELIVRKLTHALGYRFRLHSADLPGKPDLAFAGRRAVIFVNGCFWHGHDCKRGARVPKTNRDYWIAKVARNTARDNANLGCLKKAGWRALVLWECELTDPERVARRLARFLGALPHG